MFHNEATTRYTYYDSEYDDAVIETTGYFDQGSGKYEYGLSFRASTDGTQYYVFTVTNDGRYNVALYKNDKYEDLIPYTASPVVKTGNGNANHLVVVMRGSLFEFYLNDQFVGTFRDTTIPRGVVGLFFYNDTPRAQVRFILFKLSTFLPP